MKLSGSMAYLRIIFMLKALSAYIDRVWSSLLTSSAMVIAASLVDGMSLRLRFYFYMCSGVSFWVGYGCPKRGFACDKRSVRVDEICLVPCCVIWADSWGVAGGMLLRVWRDMGPCRPNYYLNGWGHLGGGLGLWVGYPSQVG